MFAIYNNNGFKENKGGPAGYLYHLNIGLSKIGKDIKILSDPITAKEDSVNDLREKSKISCELVEEFKSVVHFVKKGVQIGCKKRNVWEKYEVLHIESSEDVFYLKKFCGYKGKIILTSHKPETLAEEKINAINLKNHKTWKCRLLKYFYDFIERSSYRYSCAFIFPSKNSEKIYHDFPGYLENAKSKPIKYVYTGCCKKSITKSNSEYRSELNISKNKFVVSYIGRHNYIKGYDILTNISNELFYNNIQVVCAGPTSTIEYPISDNWIELGFIKDVQNLINMSNLVVVPNRNTYFDLVIIEVLSQGKIVITSNTGGNIDISKSSSGLVLFQANDEKSLLDQILRVRDMNEAERDNMEIDNLNFYLENCSEQSFAKNYCIAINEILDDLAVNFQI